MLVEQVPILFTYLYATSFIYSVKSRYITLVSSTDMIQSYTNILSEWNSAKKYDYLYVLLIRQALRGMISTLMLEYGHFRTSFLEIRIFWLARYFSVCNDFTSPHNGIETNCLRVLQGCKN